MDVPTPIVSGTPATVDQSKPTATPTPPVLFALYTMERLFFTLFLVFLSCEWAKAEKFTFKPPSLSEEEQHSNFLPENMVCDGCRAVGYQLFSAFDKKTNGNKRRIDETAVYDVIEES